MTIFLDIYSTTTKTEATEAVRRQRAILSDYQCI